MRMLFPAVLLGISCSHAAEIDHQPESMPIRYKPRQHEAELFGYRPAFVPSLTTFDPQNRPYIREWGDPQNKCPAIQTQKNEGSWIKRKFDTYLPKGAVLGHWTSMSDYGTVIDKDGDLYVLVDAAGIAEGCWYLMHSRDQGKNWTPYPLPFGPMPGDYQGRTLDGNRAVLQPNTRAGFLEHPPVIAGNDESHLLLLVPKKNPDGTLSIPSPIVLEDVSGDRTVPLNASWKRGWGGIGHDGQKKIASFGDEIFVVWSRPIAVDGLPGTPMYIAHCNRRQKRLVDGPTWIGNNGIEIDSHNQPVVGVDSKGYIHVLMGCHGTMENNHETVLYLRSRKPLDISTFTKPVRLPATGCTYPDMVIDRNDTLHVVCRRYEPYAVVTPETFELGYVYANSHPGNYSAEFPLYPRSQLAYFRKKVDSEWMFKPLVISWFGTYVYWHNRISLDACDRIFISYRYGPHIDPALDTPAASALLFSGDGGNSWKLATTKDLHPSKNQTE